MSTIGSELHNSLLQILGWNKARLDCFTQMVLAVISVKTVNLVEWSMVFMGKAKQESSYVRIRRFFKSFVIDFDVIADMLFSWFGLHGESIYLTLDRTNWQFGSSKINILMLGVVYKGIAIPLYWSLLDKKGNSNYQERVELITKFINKFGGSCNVKGLLGDREFIGAKWFDYLKSQQIPFYFRIKSNMLVSNKKGKMTNAMFLFSGLKRCEVRILEHKRILSGLKLSIVGARCPDGGYIIIATTESQDNAIEIYRKRWEIETLFGCLKTRGFNFEDTHLTDKDRLMKLIVVLAIGFSWAHKIGEWHNQIKPIKFKKHGRLAESIFHYRFKILRKLIFDRPKISTVRKLITLLELPPEDIKFKKLGATI